MVRNLNRLFLLRLIAMAALMAAPAAAADLVGRYRCIGSNPNGGQYQANIVIERSGEGYRLTWTIGGAVHHGIAIRTGNVLASSWSPAPNQHGIVSYRIGRRGNLRGLWAQYPDVSRLFPEDCEPTR